MCQFIINNVSVYYLTIFLFVPSVLCTFLYPFLTPLFSNYSIFSIILITLFTIFFSDYPKVIDCILVLP